MRKRLYNNIRLGGEAYLKLEWFYRPIEISNWTGDFNETYEVPSYAYLKVTARSKGGDGGEAINGTDQHYFQDIVIGSENTFETHYYLLGGGGGGGAEFEGEYYGNEINVQKNDDIITLTFDNKQIVITPGQDGSNNYLDTNSEISNYATYHFGNQPTDYTYGYHGEGGNGGIVNLPTNTDEWENISSVVGTPGQSLGWPPNTSISNHELLTQTYSIDNVPTTNYTVPDINDTYHLAGGSPRGGRGLVANVVGEPNASNRLGGDAYLKLEWFERPEN